MDLRSRSSSAFRFLAADLNDVHRLYAAAAGRDVDAIVHCGGISGPMLARDNPFLICETNIRGTAHVFELARQTSARRVVFCSSIAAYGPLSDPVVTEDGPLRPQTVYGASKVAGEAILRGYAEEHGVDGVALRIASVYGPGRRTQCFVRQLIEAALTRQVTHVAQSRRLRRQYVYVTDVVEAICRVVDAPRLPQRVYNIGSGSEHTLEEVATLVGQVVGPVDVTFDDSGDVRHHSCGRLDLAAAARDFEYRPAVPLEGGIANYAAWLRTRS